MSEDNGEEDLAENCFVETITPPVTVGFSSITVWSGVCKIIVI